MVGEAQLTETEHGPGPPLEEGWFVLNACDARWRDRKGMGHSLGFTPSSEQLGIGLVVLEPGQPLAMYHWETDEEDFLVLAGEAIAIVEGQERPLQAWDFLHSPPGARHGIVGAGERGCVLFTVGARERHVYRKEDGTLEGREDWGAYTVDETAVRHGAGVKEETIDAAAAYARFDEPELTGYRPGWLPRTGPGGD
jgi:uncharacterized cupin superfamily protein